MRPLARRSCSTVSRVACRRTVRRAPAINSLACCASTPGRARWPSACTTCRAASIYRVELEARRVNVHLVLLVVYSVGIVAFGLWTARFVRHSSDFFVAGRSLGPGLILSTMLAANIGAGSTVGVAGLAYRDGISAWWWSGAAGLASLVLAFWVARDCGASPRRTTSTPPETSSSFAMVRRSAVVTAIITCVGALAILAGQLIAGAAILNVVIGRSPMGGS